MADYHVETIPFSILIDARGREVASWDVAISLKTVGSAMDALGDPRC